MTLTKLASTLALLEGKKSQVKIGDVRELIKLLRKLIKDDPSIIALLVKP